jgi:hypothetical protein
MINGMSSFQDRISLIFQVIGLDPDESGNDLGIDLGFDVCPFAGAEPFTSFNS